ncbi:MAG: hypothetical protein DRH12_00385 [Deltaproteobacteria bacterium]|nr:MAG: hypothetical protein DRH12_00385 [Deltaproteobacteria bacterium]
MGISELTAIQKINGDDRTAAMGTGFPGNVKGNQRSSQKSGMVETLQKSSDNIRQTVQDKLQRIASAMSDYIESIQRDLRIRVDDQTENIVIEVISKSSGKVIRQIPPEELLKLAARMEEMVGVFFEKSA